ncbi:hypothetical protein IIY66_02200, partial [Candidatus Saccharibacteria bacterium]|nr:hypothetical protein [Candidatus Saccharibacteria bacterium]
MSDSNIIINIVEPGSPVTPNTGLFSQGLDGGTIATISIVSFILVASIISLAYYYHKHHKLPRFTSSIKAFKLKQAKKQLTIGLSIIALLTSAFTFAGLKNHSSLGTANAAEGGGTNTSLDLTVSDVVLDVELADEPVFAVAPVTLTVAEATQAGYTLKAYAEDTTLSSTETDKTISMITLSEEAATSALSDNTWGLATEEPEAKDNEIFYSLPESAADAIILTDKDYKETAANDTTTVYLGFYITPDLPYGTYTGATVDYSAEENAVATVTFDGNGKFYFDNASQSTNEVTYIAGRQSSKTYYSHTPNVNDEGVQTEGEMYPLDSNETFVYDFGSGEKAYVTIVKTDGDNSCGPDSNDYFSFWAGSHPDYTAKGDWESGIKIDGSNGKYTFYKNATYNGAGTVVDSDSVTFAYTTSADRASWCVESGYGYYAKIAGYVPNKAMLGNYETPETDGAYRFLGWDTDKGATTPTYTSVDAIERLLDLSSGDPVTLYAISEPAFTISYNGNGADATTTMTSIEQYTTDMETTEQQVDLLASNFQKEGYG